MKTTATTKQENNQFKMVTIFRHTVSLLISVQLGIFCDCTSKDGLRNWNIIVMHNLHVWKNYLFFYIFICDNFVRIYIYTHTHGGPLFSLIKRTSVVMYVKLTYVCLSVLHHKWYFNIIMFISTRGLWYIIIYNDLSTRFPPTPPVECTVQHS